MGTYFKSKIEPYFHRNVERFPYAEKSNIRVLCDYYRVSPPYITLSNHGEVDWMGIFFWTKVNYNIHIFSGGRFGYAGFFPKNVSCPVSEYLPLIDNWQSSNPPKAAWPISKKDSMRKKCHFYFLIKSKINP